MKAFPKEICKEKSVRKPTEIRSTISHSHFLGIMLGDDLLSL